MHLVNCYNCIFIKLVSDLTDIPDICFKGPTTTPAFGGPLEGHTGAKVVVPTAVVGNEKGKDLSGGIWRIPCTGFLCSFSATRRGHVEHAPFSSSEVHQHVCSVSAQGSPLETQS